MKTKWYQKTAWVAIPLVLWLSMFPEFSITADNCRVVNEQGEVVECDLTDRELAMAVLEADGEELVIKSRLWELLMKWSDETKDGKGTN